MLLLVRRRPHKRSLPSPRRCRPCRSHWSGSTAGPDDPEDLPRLRLLADPVASREAAYLAAYTALSIPALSAMRLIQERKVPISRPNARAEVLLSGLLRPVDVSHGLYDVVDGARDALLQTLPF